MKEQIKPNQNVLFLLKCLLCSYIITVGMLLLLALLLYRFQLKENMVSIVIIMIYIIATFVAGFIAGKRMQNKKFLWGLFVGAVYFVILLTVSLLVNHTVKDAGTNLLTTLVLCAGSGMLGGMLS